MVTFLTRLFRSTIMIKIIMAVSGLGIIGFLLAHLTGNLLMFGGPEKINAYGQSLRDLGPVLWLLRGGILLFFIAHIVSAIMLGKRNRAARPIGYTMKKPIKATIFSRTMMLSGLTVFSFVAFHLAHYTFGKIQPEFFNGEYTLHDGRVTHNVYEMVVYGFENPVYTLLYVLCMTLLGFHLSHALTSAIQTFGLNNPKYSKFLRRLGPSFAVIIVAAYLSIPVSVITGILKHKADIEHTALSNEGGIIKEIKQ